LRIDAHHSFSDRYPLEHLDTILKRNRFDASIAVVDHPIERWHILPITYPQPGNWCVGGWALARAGPRPRPPFDHLPLDLDLEARDLPLVLDFAEHHPHLRIALDHLAHPPISGPLDDWARDLEHAAQCPNIYCKLSGITSAAFRPAVRHALAVFGPARLMFGSDWPNHLPEVSWKVSLAAFTQSIGAQPIEIREQLLGGTAQRFYGLPDALPSAGTLE